MKCEWEDYHDDMYPEFAPEPLVVRCTEAAIAFIITENAYPSEENEGEACVGVFCDHHFKLMISPEAAEVQDAKVVAKGFFGSLVQLP